MSDNQGKLNIKDVLHYYLGRECETPLGKMLLSSICVHEKYPVWFRYEIIGESCCPEQNYNVLVKNDCSGHGFFYSEVKPVLRPLSDMTEEEAKACYRVNPYSKGEWLIKSVFVKENIKGFEPNIVEINWGGKESSSGYACGTDYMYFNKLSAEQFKYLLSKHFDLFGLIENGQAIDKTKLQPK